MYHKQDFLKIDLKSSGGLSLNPEGKNKQRNADQFDYRDM